MYLHLLITPQTPCRTVLHLTRVEKPLLEQPLDAGA